MNYREATDTQLNTIAHHEPCTRAEKLRALLELTRRKQNTPRNQSQAVIKRKRG